jgi:Leucine-rich repeat (LRR) protein
MPAANIIQLREDILLHDNTAQERLIEILEKKNRGSEILQINEALSGDVDLAVLKEHGFSNVTTIEFKEDVKITQLLHIPEQLIQLICRKNLLFSLEDLPDTLTDLDIAHNHIEALRLQETPVLEKLNVSHNEIVELGDLPPTLTELVVHHNKLGSLNLAGLENLKTLHISHNPITLVENKPENIVHFYMDNTPSVEFRNSSLPHFEEDEEEDQVDIDEDGDHAGRYKDSLQLGGAKAGKKLKIRGEVHTFQDALHGYFQLKSEYENKTKVLKKKHISKILEDATLSLKKRARFAKKALQTFKSPCVICKRPVGSIFEIKDNRYIARCGDMMNPCKLNIQIYSGQHTPVTYLIGNLSDELEKVKETIICQKLDTLFNYISERNSVSMFKDVIEGFSTYNEMLTELTNKYTELYHNEQKKSEQEKKEADIFIMVERIRELLRDYVTEGNPRILESIMHMQVNEFMPEIRNLRMMKYEVFEMEGRDFSRYGGYRLIRMPVSLSKTENTFGEANRVVSFVK